MVASTLAREGKTLTAANLALTLSESYRRSVLVIDADLRRPSMHDVFQVPNMSGLSDRLKAEGGCTLRVIEISPRLSLLPAGQPDADPMGALTSDAMADLLRQAGSSYDWVVIDTPPVGLMPDAKILAAMVDVAMLVIAAGQTPYHLLQKAVEAIGPERILGVVLNKVADEAVPAGSYYGSYLSVSAGGAGS
jgi:capsular exopolysaccharide synthesis family protein